MYLRGHFYDPVKMQDALALTSRSGPVGIPIFNPRNTVLFPAIATVDDGEMCVSRVFRTRGGGSGEIG